MNGISLVNLSIIEQLGVAQLTVDTGNTGGANRRSATAAVFEDRVPTVFLVRTKVPVVAVTGTISTESAGLVVEQSCITRHFHIEILRVPVTGEVLDWFPVGGVEAQLLEVQVLHQLIAIAQRIPVAAAVGESRQNLLGVCRIDTMDEVRHLLVTLVSGTDFALLALRNPHQGIDAQLHFLRRCFILATNAFKGKVTNLVHDKVAGTCKVEVVRTLATVNGGFVQFAQAYIGEIRCTTAILYPNIIECNLTVTMRQCSGNRISLIELVRPVGRRTVFDVGVCHSLLIGIAAIRADVQAAATINGGFCERTMRAAGRHDSGRNRQRVDNPTKILFITGGIVSGANEGVGVVLTHQGVHVPVTGVDLVAAERIITSSRIIRVNILLGVFNVRIAGTAAVSVEVSTRIRVHGVVTNSKTIAIANEILQGIVGFAGKVGLTVVAGAPIYAVVTVVALSILQILVGVNVK